jgi:hypothetical protein
MIVASNRFFPVLGDLAGTGISNYLIQLKVSENRVSGAKTKAN